MQAEARGGELLTPSLRRFWLAAAAALIADLASKAVIFHILGGGLPPDSSYTDDHVVWVLPGAFRLICHYNTGGAFGVMAGQVFVFLAATAVLAPVLVMTAYHTKEPDAPLWSLGMILGGAAGNLYDRLFHVGVRDFLEIIDPKTGTNLWPVFNVADIAIVVGVMVYVVWSILDFFHKRRQAAATAAEAEPE